MAKQDPEMILTQLPMNPFFEKFFENLRLVCLNAVEWETPLSKLLTLISFTILVPENISLKLCKRFPLNQLQN